MEPSALLQYFDKFYKFHSHSVPTMIGSFAARSMFQCFALKDKGCTQGYQAMIEAAQSEGVTAQLPRFPSKWSMFKGDRSIAMFK